MYNKGSWLDLYRPVRPIANQHNEYGGAAHAQMCQGKPLNALKPVVVVLQRAQCMHQKIKGYLKSIKATVFGYHYSLDGNAVSYLNSSTVT